MTPHLPRVVCVSRTRCARLCSARVYAPHPPCRNRGTWAMCACPVDTPSVLSMWPLRVDLAKWSVQSQCRNSRHPAIPIACMWNNAPLRRGEACVAPACSASVSVVVRAPRASPWLPHTTVTGHPYQGLSSPTIPALLSTRNPLLCGRHVQRGHFPVSSCQFPKWLVLQSGWHHDSDKAEPATKCSDISKQVWGQCGALCREV